MSPVAFEQKLDHVLFAAHQKGWIVSVNARRFQGGFGLRQRKPAQGHQVDKELLSIDVPSGLLRSPNVRQMCQYTYSFAIRIVNVTYNRGGSQEQEDGRVLSTWLLA